MKKIPLFFIVLVCMLAGQLKAADDFLPQSRWIGSEHSQSTPNTWLCFRKTIELPGVPGEVIANIAVDSKYWLWINGELVVFEGGLKRGPAPGATYYDRVDMAPSVLSALYSSVLPAYIDLLKTRTPDEALDEALALVNNVSKKRLLNNVGSVRLLLQEMEPDVQSEAENGNSFIKLLGKEAKESVQEVYNYSGMYLSYSLSSSTDSLKIEPYMICASENNEYVKVGMINAYKSVHWGSGIISNHQNSYLMFNERDLPQFALVTIYLQLPHYEFPNMLKGLYLCLDYNHNPIARRIVLVKQSDSTDVNQFLEMEGCLVPRAELTPELEVYYNYTCQEGDYIKTCTVPSPKLDETDLEREKKMLKI